MPNNTNIQCKFNNAKYTHPVIEHIIANGLFNHVCGIICSMKMNNKSLSEIAKFISLTYAPKERRIKPADFVKIMEAYPKLYMAFNCGTEQLYGETTFVAQQGLYGNEEDRDKAKIAIQLRKQVIDELAVQRQNTPVVNTALKQKIDILIAAMQNLEEPEAPDESYLDFDRWNGGEDE